MNPYDLHQQMQKGSSTGIFKESLLAMVCHRYSTYIAKGKLNLLEGCH